MSFTNHYLRIKIEGYRIDRILTKAIEKNIVLRNLKHLRDTEIEVLVSKEDYNKLKKLTKNNYKITIIEEKGVTPRVRSILKNKMAIVGICIFIAVIVLQNMFVTEINIIGYKSIPEEDIRKVLKEEGLYEGCYKNFNCDKLEKKLFERFDNIVWAKVAYEGRYVEVAITESKKIEKKEIDEDIPCDIVADRSCYISEIFPYKGVAVVEPNDYVKKGQVIISGVVPIESTAYGTEFEKMKEFFVHAQGIVKAKIPYSKTFSIEKTKKIREKTGKKTFGVVIEAFGKNIDLSRLGGILGNYEKAKIEDKKIIDIKVPFPLKITFRTINEITEKSLVVNKKEINKQANKLTRQWLEKKLPENAQILNKSLNFSIEKNIIEVRVVVEVLQEIGEEQEIVIGEDNRGIEEGQD